MVLLEDQWLCEIDFWPCRIVLGLSRSIFCLASSFMALRDKFIAMRDHFLPCEVVFGLARRSYHYILLHKGGSANPLPEIYNVTVSYLN